MDNPVHPLALLEADGRALALHPDLVLSLMAMQGQIVANFDLAAHEAAAIEAQSRMAAQAQANGGVAVVPLVGMITPRLSLMALLFGGGAGLQVFRGQLAEAVSNPDVKGIVLNVDSPGGTVDGVPEAAADIRAAREKKPIVAVANSMMASAAYWLASQAHEVIASPSAQVGSIGVYRLHRDLSGAHKQAGINPTLISAGKYKVEGHPYAPLTDEAAQAAQSQVDDLYAMFVKDVAKGRGVEPQAVQDGFGQGRMELAARAVRSGLADKVATLPQTVSRLASGRAVIRQHAAEDQSGETHAEGEGQDDHKVVALSREERIRLLDTLAGTR